MGPKIFFTSDTHFQHTNILKYASGRAAVGGFAVDDVEAHDRWLIKKWNDTIGKKDIVYILGDFAFGSPESVRKILSKLNGHKFLILGNHDKSSDHLQGYFTQITQIKCVTFKQKNYDFLEENFNVVMCHYPMITWSAKHHGHVMLHGHCHGSLDEFNEQSTDLRVDVGLDGKLAQHDFITLEQLYSHFKKKTEGKLLTDYAEEKLRESKMLN